MPQLAVQIQKRGAKRLALKSCARRRHSLSMSFSVDGSRFKKNYEYRDVDFFELEDRYGINFMRRVYFHILALEAISLVSFQPEEFDCGPFSDCCTKEFESFWNTIVRNIGAQWRYENDLPDYDGPSFACAPAPAPAPIEIECGPVEAINFNGGGKDSLVAMKLLERAGIAFASFSYSHPVYGPAQSQHRLLDDLLESAAPHRRHQLRILDEFWERPQSRLQQFGVKTSICAETPVSIFAVLPVALQHGYRYIILGNEMSADAGNFQWARTGEMVNHQWGKSLEAERLINHYIRRELISNVSYFSILKPIHDVVIFNMLRDDLEAVRSAHSCNVKKPWCGACAKCAYVWLNYMAYLPVEVVSRIFQKNLFDAPENRAWFRQLLGLDSHKPFECVGEIAETSLAFELCLKKGLTGLALDMYRNEAPSLNVRETLDHYLAVRDDLATIPSSVGRRVFPQMTKGASKARQYILSLI